MKKLKIAGTIITSMKFLIVISAGLLNVFGLYFMLIGMPIWKDLITYSIFVLGLSLVFSIIAKLIDDKLFNQTLNLFLKEENISNYEVLGKRDDFVLIKVDEQVYSIYVDKTKNGYGFVMSPAEVNLEGKLVSWDGRIEDKKVSYIAGWSGFSWSEKEDSTTI